MNKLLNNREVLLIKSPDSDEIKAVAGQNADGTPKTVLPEAGNSTDFMTFDKHDGVLENFFSDFMSKVENSENFQFFKSPANEVESTVWFLNDIMSGSETNNPEDMRDFYDHVVMPAYYTSNKFAVDKSFSEKIPSCELNVHADDEKHVHRSQFKIPETLLGVKLPEKQQANLKSGQTVYVAGMKDPEGNDFDAYIQVNTGKSKLDFFKHNPDKAQKTGEAPDKTDDTLKKNQAQPVEKQSVMKKPRGFKV